MLDSQIYSDPAFIAFRSLSSSRFLGFVQRLGAGGSGELHSLGCHIAKGRTVSNQRPFTSTRIGLIAAVSVPFLYFGAQLAAAPFFPGYSFLSNSASMLGSDRSTLPAVLNTGAFITGIATLLAAYGFFRSLSLVGTKSVLIWLVALSVISTGVASIWASIFHLPDPRHNPGALGAGTFVGPLFFLLALWPAQNSNGLKAYLVINLVVFALLVPVLGGFAGVDLQRFGGLLQRCAAAVLYIPIGVVGLFLLRRTKQPNP